MNSSYHCFSLDDDEIFKEQNNDCLDFTQKKLADDEPKLIDDRQIELLNSAIESLENQESNRIFEILKTDDLIYEINHLSSILNSTNDILNHQANNSSCCFVPCESGDSSSLTQFSFLSQNSHNLINYQADLSDFSFCREGVLLRDNLFGTDTVFRNNEISHSSKSYINNHYLSSYLFYGEDDSNQSSQNNLLNKVKSSKKQIVLEKRIQKQREKENKRAIREAMKAKNTSITASPLLTRLNYTNNSKRGRKKKETTANQTKSETNKADLNKADSSSSLTNELAEFLTCTQFKKKNKYKSKRLKLNIDEPTEVSSKSDEKKYFIQSINHQIDNQFYNSNSLEDSLTNAVQNFNMLVSNENFENIYPSDFSCSSIF
jgi:hypothetical protein